MIDRISMDERHDRLQHVDRGRRALRLRESRRDDVRLPARARTFAPPGAGVRSRRRLLESHRAPTPTRATTTSSGIDGRRASSRSSRGASRPASRRRSARRCRADRALPEDERPLVDEAYRYMQLAPGEAGHGHEDRRRLHRLVHERPRLRIFAEVVRASAGPRVPRRAAREGARRARLAGGAATSSCAAGYDQVFRDAGFELREAGCSMCLAMNPDKLESARSSARRRRTATSRAARARRPGARCSCRRSWSRAAAIAGEVADARELFDIDGRPA